MTNTSAIGAATSHTNKPCPFCALPAGRVIQENESAVLILDGCAVQARYAMTNLRHLKPL
jgi:hypothetical protein